MTKPRKAKRSKDFDLRAALVDYLFAHGFQRWQIRHELTHDTGGFGGRCDVALLLNTGQISGLEIKSGSDTDERLKAQMRAGSLAFDSMAVLADIVHCEKIRHEWAYYCHEKKCLISQYPSIRGGEREAITAPPSVTLYRRNSRDTSLAYMLRLLWRNEVRAIAAQHGVNKATREDCLRWISENLALKDARPLIYEQLRNRPLSAYEATFWRKYDARATVPPDTSAPLPPAAA